MGMNGFEDRPPVRMPVALMDVLASHQIRMAALEGLSHAQAANADSLPKYRWKEVELPPLSIKPRTNWSTAIRPSEMADNTPTLPPTATSWHARTAMWSCGGQRRQFEGLCRVLNIPELATDERFASNQQRVIHRDALVVDLNRAASDWHKAALNKRWESAPQPGSSVRSTKCSRNQTIAGRYRIHPAQGEHVRWPTACSTSVKWLPCAGRAPNQGLSNSSRL